MEAMLGMIILWPISWVPEGFSLCDGKKLPIQDYQALYSLIGNSYGGDGIKDFALPDMRNHFVMGSSYTGSRIFNGQTGGSKTLTIGLGNLPAHTHAATFAAGKTTPATSAQPATATLLASTASGTTTDPTNNYIAGVTIPAVDAFSSPTPLSSFIDPTSAAGTLVPLQGLSVTEASGDASTTQSGTVTVSPTGAGIPLDSLPPFVMMAYIMCISGGEYPVQPM